jgi:hypothetical protein
MAKSTKHEAPYHIKIALGDFNAKVGREDILNQKLGMKVYRN